MKEFTITTTKTVTQQEIDDIVTTALEGGINYWCDGVRIRQEPREEYDYTSEVLTRGGTIELHEDDYPSDQAWHQLTLEKLLKALGEVNFFYDNYYAADADILIQTALWGEVVYG